MGVGRVREHGTGCGRCEGVGCTRVVGCKVLLHLFKDFVGCPALPAAVVMIEGGVALCADSGSRGTVVVLGQQGGDPENRVVGRAACSPIFGVCIRKKFDWRSLNYHICNRSYTTLYLKYLFLLLKADIRAVGMGRQCAICATYMQHATCI